MTAQRLAKQTANKQKHAAARAQYLVDAKARAEAKSLRNKAKWAAKRAAAEAERKAAKVTTPPVVRETVVVPTVVRRTTSTPRHRDSRGRFIKAPVILPVTGIRGSALALFTALVAGLAAVTA